MTTPNTPSRVEEKLEEFYELTNVAVAIQSGMLVARNSEQDLIDAWEKVNDWLHTTLTELETEKERAVEAERKKCEIEFAETNSSTDISIAISTLNRMSDIFEKINNLDCPKQTN